MPRPPLDSFVGTASKPSLDSFVQSAMSPEPQQPDLLSKAASVASSIFPGTKPLGEAIGNSLSGIWQSIVQGSVTPALQAGAANNQNYGKIVGSTAYSALTPASLAIGGPAGSGLANVAGRIATNAVVGAGLGGSQAAAEGKSVGTGAVTGGLVGGALSAAGEGLSAILSSLPNRLVRQALPKLKPGNEEYALKNTNIGSIKTLLADSNASTNNLNNQVQTILSHPEYVKDIGNGAQALDDTLAKFPNSELSNAVDVALAAKSVVPSQAKLVDKVLSGTATLAEKNTLRVALDRNTYANHMDLPRLSFDKTVAHELANNLRNEVQTLAPETAPVFSKWSQEINLNKALTVMQKRIDNNRALGLYDITAGLAGFATGGPVGTAIAIGTEKAARSPAVGLAAAKAAQATAKAAPQAANLLKVPVVNSLVSGQPDQPTGPIGSQVSSPDISTLSPEQQAAVHRGIEIGKMVDPSGTIGAVEKTGLKALANIHPDDIHVVQRYITGLRGGDVTESVMSLGEKLAQKWGINLDQSAAKIAKVMEDILSSTDKAYSTVVQSRDKLGRFK